MDRETLETTCCVVGGGPAGMMFGYLLARRGVAVTVIEKHKDFFRDFRGDTVHPSTLRLLEELGLLEDFLKIPHQELTSLGAVFGDFAFQAADFRHVPGPCKFVVLMPQWDFLAFLAAHARKFPSFHLLMEHEAVDVTRDAEQFRAVTVKTPTGAMEIKADLIVGCDGRRSAVREAAHLKLIELGVPMDVLWFRLSRRDGDPDEVLGNVNYGRALILINRGAYFQAGFIVPKDSFEATRARGLEAFRESLGKIAPFLQDRVQEVKDWDQVKLLSVQINRLQRWHRPGLLCIGDSAHAMSPAGGVGINLAVQDAVAAANLLADPLLEQRVKEADLARVQKRREFPTRVTQQAQVNAHKGLEYIFRHEGELKAPWQMKALVRLPGLQRALAYGVGIGVRPEHVEEPRAKTSQPEPWKKVAAGLVVGVAVAGFAMRVMQGRKRTMLHTE
jgi:2-polyprenyl-6-methoxyphenol hydroxylase-like FAD-dependent oxidoreductase